MSEKRFEEEGDNTEAGGDLGSILLSSDDGAWSGDGRDVDKCERLIYLFIYLFRVGPDLNGDHPADVPPLSSAVEPPILHPPDNQHKIPYLPPPLQDDIPSSPIPSVMAKARVTAYLLFLTLAICLGSMQFGYHLVRPPPSRRQSLEFVLICARVK